MTTHAGLHQWRLYKRYSTPIDVTNLRPSRLFLFQIVFQLLLPATALATVLLQVYGYRGPVCGVEVLTLVTMLLCWSVSCVLTSLERSEIHSYNQGVISAKSVWERFIRVKKVCDKIWPKLKLKVLFMAKFALNKSC